MLHEQENSTASKQSEIPSHDRWKIRIRRALALRNFEEATHLAHQALDEFPEDSELVNLEEQVIQWKQRKIQAYLWMDEGKQLCAENNFEEGLQVLRSAVSLDEHDPIPRSFLVDALLHAAVETIEDDWRFTEALVQEAFSLDPANPVAKSVMKSLKEKEQNHSPSKVSGAARKEMAVPVQLPIDARPLPEPPAHIAVVAKSPGLKPVLFHSSPGQRPTANFPTTAKDVGHVTAGSESRRINLDLKGQL